MEFIQEITLDLNANTAYTTIAAKQSDNGSRKILVHLTKDNIPYEADPNNQAYFRCRKPDGHAIIDPAEINADGTITVVLTNQALSTAGRAYADVVEYRTTDSATISTASFILIIMAAPDVADAAISSDEFGYLQEVVNDANTIINEAEAWARGTRGGTPVSEEDPNYENNAKYYSKQAQVAKEGIEDLTVSSTTLETGSPASVTKTVNPETGIVNLAFGLPAGIQGQTGSRGPSTVWVGTEAPIDQDYTVWLNPEGTSEPVLLTAEQMLYDNSVEYTEGRIGAVIKNIETNTEAVEQAAEQAAEDAAAAKAAAGQVTVIGDRVSTLETDIVKKIENPNLEKTQKFGILVVKYVKDEVTSENFNSKKSYLFIKDYEEDTNVTAENFESKKSLLFIKVNNTYNSLDDSAIFDNTQTYYVLIYISLDESAVFNSTQTYYKKENQWQEKLNYGQDLINLPYLNEVELKGNLTLNNLGIAPAAPGGKDYYVRPDDGIPYEDLAGSVQTSLGLADNAATQIIVNNDTYNTENNVINLGHILTDNNIINKNYLDNPWFTINQRGVISYTSSNPATAGTYLYDRWKVITNETEDRAITANKNSLYIGKTTQGDVNDSIVIGQLIDDNTWSSLSKKKVTASVNYSFDGTTFKTASWSFTCPEYNISSSELYKKQFDDHIGWGAQVLVQEFDSKKYLIFEIFWKGNAWGPVVEDSIIYIAKTKLELGNFSTLNQEAMPLYDEELKRCQRYLMYYGGFAYEENAKPIVLGSGIAASSGANGQINWVINIPKDMVKNPIIESSVNLSARRGFEAATASVGVLASGDLADSTIIKGINGIYMETKASNLTATAPYFVTLPATASASDAVLAYFSLSAEP